jgi:hypothetical protein
MEKKILIVFEWAILIVYKKIRPIKKKRQSIKRIVFAKKQSISS